MLISWAHMNTHQALNHSTAAAAAGTGGGGVVVVVIVTFPAN